MAINDEHKDPPPPPISLENGPPADSYLRVETADPNSLIVVWDCDRRIVGSGIRVFEGMCPSGVLEIELRVAGRQIRTHIINEPDRSTEVRLPPAIHHSVLPSGIDWRTAWLNKKPKKGTGDLLILLRPWDESNRDSLWSESENVLRLLPAPRRLAIPRRKPWSPTEAISIEEGNFRAFGWHAMAPGVWEVEFPLPPLGNRRNPVFIVEGYLTLICAYQIAEGPDLSQGVICLWPLKEIFASDAIPLPLAIERMLESAGRTEIALDALYFAQIGVTNDELLKLAQGEIEEPIRAMATAYASLIPFLNWFDAYNRGDNNAANLLPKDSQKTLTFVIGLGKTLFEHFPQSVDARLITVAGLWFMKAVISQDKQAPQEALAFGARRLPLFVPILRLIGVGIIYGLIILAIGFPLLDDTSSTVSPMIVGLIIILNLAGIGWACMNYVRNARRVDFVDPPLFSVGMDILLRLSALSEMMCRADSRISDIALRLTTDSLWTRWNSDISVKEARTRFYGSLIKLARQLNIETETLSEMASDMKETRSLMWKKAAKRLALALRYPQSLVKVALKRLKTADLQRVGTVPDIVFAAALNVLKDALTTTRSTPDSTPQTKWYQLKITPIGILTAIVILTILSAITFPVYMQARMKARSSLCTSNEKAIISGLQMYAQDNDDMLPRPILPQNEAEAKEHWKNAIFPYMKTITRNNPEVLFLCPFSDHSNEPKQELLSYMYNRRLQGQPKKASEVAINARKTGETVENACITSRSLSSLPLPAETVVCFDASGASLDFVTKIPAHLIYGVGDLIGRKAIIPPRDKLWEIGEQSEIEATARHHGSGVFAFSDGHFKSYTKAEFSRKLFTAVGSSEDEIQSYLSLPDDNAPKKNSRTKFPK